MTLEERLDPSRAALIVVDMQVDFCDPEGVIGRAYHLDVAGAQGILNTVRALAQAARRAGVPVVYTLMQNDDSTESPAFAGRSLLAGKSEVCRTGSPGARLWGVEPGPGDILITKHRHSAFHGTDLDLRLRSLGREAVVLCGVSTNVCVESTARDACALDYWPIVIGDACSSYSVEEHEAGIRNIDRYFGIAASARQVLPVWSS